MEASIASLSSYQISNFFRQNVGVTQSQCDQEAERVAGAPTSPSPVQGGSSYTVIAGEDVVQFRRKASALNLALLKYVEQTYTSLVPCHSSAGEFQGLHAYIMNNIGGVSMYLAREDLFKDDCLLLRQTLKDFAIFFASAWHNTPNSMPSPNRGDMLNDYALRLTKLADGLPSRFRPTLDYLIHHLPSLFSEDWPMVPHHMDLLENNIHVDPSTGKLVGLCDWAGAEIGPFGVSLWGLDTMLGIRGKEGWRYHTNQQALRELFWDEFYKAVGIPPDDRIEVARLIGILFHHGWQQNDERDTVPVHQEGQANLNYIDAVVLGIRGTDIVWNA